MSETDSENEYESADEADNSGNHFIQLLNTTAQPISQENNATCSISQEDSLKQSISPDESKKQPISQEKNVKMNIPENEHVKMPISQEEILHQPISSEKNVISSVSQEENLTKKEHSLKHLISEDESIIIQPISEKESVKMPISHKVINVEEPISQEESVEKSISQKESVEKSISQEESVEKSISQEENLKKPISLEDSLKQRILVEESEQLPIPQEKSSSYPDQSKIENPPPNAPSMAESAKIASETVSISKQENVADANKNSVVVTQPKRVPLRLEKRQQERTQSKMAEPSEEPIAAKPQVSSWGFSSWGTSLISSAATSMSTFTSQVSQGIGTVIETVESTLGAPPPEDLASILRERKESKDTIEESVAETEGDIEAESEDDGVPSSISGSLFTGMSSLTKVLENTGSKVIMGGLDTLEMIGKKTIDILTEGDPGLRQKRSAFNRGTTTLSQMLKEAKQKADTEENNSTEDYEESVCYSKLFDDFQGLVHLEALEMLSGQCDSRVQGILMMGEEEFGGKPDLDNIRNICDRVLTADELSDDDMTEQDFEVAILEHLKLLTLPIKLEKISSVRKDVGLWLAACIEEQNKGEVKVAKDLHQKAIQSLAEFTAKAVEHFHKCGEIIMLQEPGFDAANCATHLTGLAIVLCTEVGVMANQFCGCLNTAADDSEDPDIVTPLITSVYLEASNSATYIQDAFQLLIPVLQSTLIA